MSVTLPRCAGCGERNPHVVGNSYGGHDWLCGDCEWKLEHPDAEPAPELPRARPALPLQEERLFSLEQFDLNGNERR